MIGFLLRRFRWMAVGAGVKYIARRGVGRSVDDAAAQIEERLPAPVARAANALPGDIVKAGGAAVVSARAARSSAPAAKSGGVVAARVTKSSVQLGARASALRPGATVSDRLQAARRSIADQAGLDERELRADFLRYQGDDEAATDALLDLRTPRDDGPLPEVPDAVATGRRRFTGPRRAPEVGRAQRSYRRPTKPWDRPLRRSERRPTTPEAVDGNPGEQSALDR